MAAYGYCYDPAVRCRSGCQPGVRIYRQTIQKLIPERGDLGCFNCRPSRTGNTLSLHGEGRASDEATPRLPNGWLDLPWNTRYGDFCVAAAQDLGIQRVIGWGPRFDGSIGPREWDSRPGERLWEYYSGPLHQDHNHVEFCWKAALNLTEKQVRDAVLRYWKGDWFAMATKKELEEVIKAQTDPLKAEIERLRTGLFSADPDKVKAAVGRAGGSIFNIAYATLQKVKKLAP